MQDRWWANIGFEPNSRTYYLLFMHKWKVMQYYACSPESNQCSHLVELSKSVPCWQETAPSYIPSECKVNQRQSHLVFQQSQVVFFVSFSGWFQFMSILLYCTSCRSGQWILHSSSGVSRLQPSAGQPESSHTSNHRHFQMLHEQRSEKSSVWSCLPAIMLCETPQNDWAMHVSRHEHIHSVAFQGSIQRGCALATKFSARSVKIRKFRVSWAQRLTYSKAFPCVSACLSLESLDLALHLFASRTSN